MTVLRALANALVSALVEPPCATCGKVLESPLDGAVCEQCWRTVAAPGVFFSLIGVPAAAAVGLYEGTLRDVIHALKYDGRRSVAPRLGRLLADRGAEVLVGADAVVPVPLHWSRYRQRGFNQADVVARHVGCPVWRVLRRTTATRSQIDLPARARHENVRDAFGSRRHQARRLEGAVVVVVDDVITTGATIQACARVLRRAGAREVRALTAARAACVQR
ncbi:MAG: ComF family protein [Acidobacteriota bacterium]